jgi:transcription antitermination protein NusB
MSNRRAAREAALKSIYAVEVGKSRTQDVTKQLIKARFRMIRTAFKFAEKLLLTTVDFAGEYDQIIQETHQQLGS